MNNKHLLLSIAFMGLTCLQAQADIDYKQLKYWHMCSEGIEEKDLDKPSKKISANTIVQPDFNLPTQTKIYKSFKCYDILSSVTKDHFAVPSQTEDQIKSLITLMRDLEVYCGQGEYPNINVASLLDRTRSASGAVVLRKMLSCPIACTRNEAFVDRQKLIHELVHNEQLYQRVEALCNAWADNEDRLLANWQDLDEVSRELFNDNYYQYRILQKFNTIPTAMELRTRVGNLMSTVQALQIPLEWAFLNIAINTFVCAQKNQQDSSSFKKNLYDACKLLVTESIPALYNVMAHPINNYNKAMQEFDNDVIIGRARAEFNGQPWDANQEQSMRKISKGVSIASPLVHWLLTAYVAYNANKVYNQARLQQDALNFMHNKLIGMGTAVRSAMQLESLAQDYDILADGLMSMQHARDLLNHHTTDVAYLVNLLQKDTFAGDASFFSLTGRVLVAQKLVDQHKDAFAGIIELMGELDACLSIATIVKEFMPQRVHYCFADLKQTSRPHMKLTNFWNPFVDRHKVVTNDIELGGNNKEQLIILTGSNTGGKSTVGLKGTLLSLYLAHTCGIVPADICDASLCHDFCSYLHVLDDTASGQSSFQAEVNRSQALIKAIKALPQDQHAFIVIDELFKGTSPEKGASNAYKIVKHIAQFDNVMCIVATHFKDLTQLSQETNGRCINMKIDVYEDADGNLVRPHKLEYGVSTQNVADAIMQAHFENI